MSDTDRFIDEVTEEVRRDRLFALMRRWGWVALLVVALIVGGAGWYEWQKSRSRLTAAQAGDELLDALALPDAGARIAGLVAADEQGPVPALLIAAQTQAAGDVPGAIAGYDAVAADATVPQLYRDMAALRSLILQAGVTPPADRIAALQQLALPGATFAPLAQEQIALAQIEAGDLDAARAMLTTITSDAATPQSVGARAGALLQALGTAEDADTAAVAPAADDAAATDEAAGEADPAATGTTGEAAAADDSTDAAPADDGAAQPDAAAATDPAPAADEAAAAEAATDAAASDTSAAGTVAAAEAADGAAPAAAGTPAAEPAAPTATDPAADPAADPAPAQD